MAAIAAGEMERGIAELKQAYAIKPHPDVLYDIAQAYVDLGRIREALEYLRRYLAEDPADKEQVAGAMRQLEAKLPPPVSAAAPLLQATTANPTSEPKPAWRPPPEPREVIFEERVVTASARSRPEMRAPASVTVITGDEIRMSGAATVPEVLRRVPGIDVAEMNPSDTNVSIRGFNRRLSNKVLVLVDGRSVYQDFLGGTFWPLIDVTLAEIERIEVIRGPGSALHGANAFAGVINVITRTGENENSSARVFVVAGDHRTLQGGITTGGKTGNLRYRTTFAYDRADKWTRDVGESRVDLAPQFGAQDRSREIQRAAGALSYDLGKVRLSGGAGFDNLGLQLFPPGALRTFAATGQSGFLRMEAASGPVRVKAFWNALRLTTGPEYWPEDSLSLKSSVRSDVVDLSMQTGFDFAWHGLHHLDVAGGYRFKEVQWKYLAARVDGAPYQEHHFNLVLQEEWEITRKLALVLSYRVDRHPLLAQQNVTAGGLVHSPRGALTYEIEPDHVLRLAAGSAYRAPTFLESYIDLFVPIPDQPAMGVRFQGNRSLRPEQMVQVEAGYRGRFGSFQQDLAVYAERVQNLISDSALRVPANPTEAVDAATGQYVAGYTGFENERGSYFGVGSELAGRWSPADGVDLGASYSYEKMFACAVTGGSGCTDGAGTPNQVSATLANTAQHKLNLAASWRTRTNFDLALAVHFVSATTWVEKSFDAGRAGGVTYAAYPIPARAMIDGRVGYRFTKDRLEMGLAVSDLLGREHREHPFGNRMGRRVLFTASGAL